MAVDGQVAGRAGAGCQAGQGGGEINGVCGGRVVTAAGDGDQAGSGVDEDAVVAREGGGGAAALAPRPEADAGEARADVSVASVARSE